jgi:hypothetical protein
MAPLSAILIARVNKDVLLEQNHSKSLHSYDKSCSSGQPMKPGIARGTAYLVLSVIRGGENLSISVRDTIFK